ncbi:MAG: ribose import ATP-binding protein RbsA [Micrococcaceae bacterium]|nr:ribose import ATP-binding protein RbsA [Micrococcaceae bacterium]
MGEDHQLNSPREALDAGIATVYQGLAVVPLMPIWRNFFVVSERAEPPHELDQLGRHSAVIEEVQTEVADAAGGTFSKWWRRRLTRMGEPAAP